MILVNKSITAPSFFLSNSDLENVLGRISFKDSFFFSIAIIASSIVLPLSGACALLAITSQRASGGTKNMPSAVYSSISSSSPYPSAFNSSYLSSNLSDKYFRNIKPNTTCLYSAASIEPLSSFAAPHISFSKPISAVFSFAINLFSHILYCFICPQFTLCQYFI